MKVTRRKATPLCVHHLWDAISQNGTNQVMDLECLVSVITSMHKIGEDELFHELNFAIDDNLIRSEVVQTEKGGETVIYKLPDVSLIETGDHDWYCFKCHLGGPVVACKDCPRVYHLECLPEDRKPGKGLFVCPACHIMATKPSAEKVVVTPKVLNQLLQYICDRFKLLKKELLEKANGKTWAVAANRGAKDAWRFQLLVRIPMDLETMIYKTTHVKYVSLEEFLVDCETLVHGIAVYFGVELLEGGQIGQEFLTDALHDIREIKLCHDCFRRSYEKNPDWWFCLPCTVPHEVVWAKQIGYPYWPAKVMEVVENRYDVRFFGDNYERGNVHAKFVQPIETCINQLNVNRTPLWDAAFKELVRFQEMSGNPDVKLKLPSKGKRGFSAPERKGSKRAASESLEKVVTKRSQKSENSSASATVVTPKTSPKSDTTKAVTTKRTNCTSISTDSNAKKIATTTPACRESAEGSLGLSSLTPSAGTSTETADVIVAPKERKQTYGDLSNSNLRPDVIAFLKELDDIEGLDGDACFSDEDSNNTDLHKKVSEDAISSSRSESKSTRNVYVQVSQQGLCRDKIIKKLQDLQSRHEQEISQIKRKQWCLNCCEREAGCCNTAYCSIECQQAFFTREQGRQRQGPV